MTTTLQTPVTAPVTSEDFEAIYASASGDSTHVPWADRRPHPALVAWLNAVAPFQLRCGARVIVVGCGLGDDARELLRRGYDVTAFDVSESAVAWAKSIESADAGCFHVADLFDPPARWRHRFDLVVEVNTIQALPCERRPDVVRAITDLASPHGSLLVICRATDEPVDSAAGGPPWPLTETELRGLTTAAGLTPDGPVSVFMDDQVPPVMRMRALFRRTGG